MSPTELCDFRQVAARTTIQIGMAKKNLADFLLPTFKSICWVIWRKDSNLVIAEKNWVNSKRLENCLKFEMIIKWWNEIRGCTNIVLISNYRIRKRNKSGFLFKMQSLDDKKEYNILRMWFIAALNIILLFIYPRIRIESSPLSLALWLWIVTQCLTCIKK